MPSKHLFRINCKPTDCDNSTWEKWYTEQHIPDLINHKASTRATFYREIFDVPHLYAHNKEKNLRNYLALYQTDYKDVLKSEEIKSLKTSVKDIDENADFDARNYELIHEFDPSGLGDTPAPYILYAELEPKNGEELDSFYREEHFPLLFKVPGYRRGLRYKLGPETPLTLGKPPTFLALHEFETVHGINNSEEMKAVTTTPWTLQIMEGVTFAEIRSFELIKAFGY